MKELTNKIKSFINNTQEEIKNSEILIIFMYWAFFSFIISFSTWINQGFTGKYSSLPCWPHFINCKNIFPLTPLPYGYSENIFYTLLLTVIIYGLYNLYKKEYLVAYYCLLLLWLWKFFVINVSYGIGNFDYYDLILIGVFLFLSDKKTYLRLFFVLLYFLASTIKIAPGWIDGTYFSSLQTGLPIFSDALAPFATTFVFLMQMVGSWFLLSRNKFLYKLSLWFFIFFHLYSTILVGYRYPLTSLFCLIILFGIESGGTTLSDIKINIKTLPHFLLILCLFSLQLIGIIIPGNQKITLEGNNYGLYMFEANHQCIYSYSITTKDQKVVTRTTSSADARNRCDPYRILWLLQKKCTPLVETVSWTFDHSINGNPLYRVIDVENICNLEYKPFTHNNWINITNPPYISNVKKNIYDLSKRDILSSTFEKKIDNITYEGNIALENNKIPKTTKIQEFILKNSKNFILFYWTLWITTLITVIYHVVLKEKEK